MNIFHKVTRKTMKNARTRTIVTIIGVILSAAMFCAVTTFGVSLQGFLIDQSIARYGDYYGVLTNYSKEDVKALAADSRVSQVGTLEFQGFAAGTDFAQCPDSYYAAAAANEPFFQSMPALLQGRLPENSNEILIPDPEMFYSEDNPERLEIGDTITLNLGWRYYPDGTPLGQMDYYDSGKAEALTGVEAHTYTIVGFMAYEYYDMYDLPAVILLTAQDDAARSGPITAYYKTYDARQAQAVLEDAPHPDGCSYWPNSELLNYYGVTRYHSLNDTIRNFAAIFIAIIMVGSVSLIHNAFSISLSERSKQFGLMSSIGATKKQLRKMIFSEAWTVSLIGIPIGAAAGVGGIGVTLYLLRNIFASLFGQEVVLRLRFSWAAVGTAALIALATVFISAWVPARRAARVTAIEAIRQNQDIQVTKKSVKTGKLTAKLFGLEGLLAKKYFKCSKKKYRSTVISLALSVVLFISASSFSMYLNFTVEDSVIVHDYDVSLMLHGDDISLYEKIQALDSVETACYINQVSWSQTRISALAELDDISPDYLRYCQAYNALYTAGNTAQLEPNVIYLDDSNLRAYLTQKGIDPSPYLDTDDPLPLVLNHGSSTVYEDDSRVTYTFDFLKPGMDTLQMGWAEYPAEMGDSGSVDLRLQEDGTLALVHWTWDESVVTEDAFGKEILDTVPIPIQEVPLGALVTEAPWGIDTPCGLTLIYPMSAAPKTEDLPYDVRLAGPDHNAIVEEVQALLAENGISAYTADYAASEETNRNMVTIVGVFAYGFIVLISLVSVANVFNTISTNVALRRRDFAMLRSMGMTNKGLNRMMNYECLLYGTRALVWGLPISLMVTVLIWRVMYNSLYSPFRLPWAAVAVAVCSVFLVVFITMLYAMAKIKKDNPIDALKNENL